MFAVWYFRGWNFEDDETRVPGVKKHQQQLDVIVGKLQKIDHPFQIPVLPQGQGQPCQLYRNIEGNWYLYFDWDA